MTDRKLLELAAKVAGYRLVWLDNRGPNGAQPYFADAALGDQWNPLENDGDALRLAVKLRLCVDLCVGEEQDRDDATVSDEDLVLVSEYLGSDPYAATRRAIVRAAAEIGRALNGR